jgi:mercuric ion binding protein
MRIFKILTIVIGILALSKTVFAQHDHSSMGSSSGMIMDMNTHMNMLLAKTATLKVWGKCEMCKSRIEKIATANGATIADWNIKTKFLTVNFDPSRTSLAYISEKLAKAGHDTGIKSAKDKAYNALPDCCKYERIR